MNQLERFKKACPRNRLVSLLVIVGTVTIAVASFTGAISQLAAFFGGTKNKNQLKIEPKVVICLKSFSYSKTRPQRDPGVS